MGTIEEMLRREGRDEGVLIGVEQGVQQGELKNAREMVIDMATEKYGFLPLSLESEIRTIQSVATLKGLGRQILKVDKIEDFTALVKKVFDQ